MPNEPRPISWLWSTAVVFIHLLSAAVVLAVLIRIVAPFERIFHDFDAELPAPTMLVISLGHLAASYWYLAPLVLMADAALLFGIRRGPPAVHGLMMAWAFLVPTVALVFVAVIIAAVQIPLLTLMAKVSK